MLSWLTGSKSAGAIVYLPGAAAETADATLARLRAKGITNTQLRRAGGAERLLDVHPELNHVEECLERPLVLVVAAALGAEDHVRLAAALGHDDRAHAPDPALLWLHQRQRERPGDHRINSVPAPREHVQPDREASSG